MHQGEDCVIDSITALEALWKLDSELAFRLAFRTASLLGTSDDLREQVLDTLRTYYRIRSKIVHGTTLQRSEFALVQNDEPLREIVRKTLRAFIHLLANPGVWTVEQLAKDPDAALLHSGKRSALQQAMAILPVGTDVGGPLRAGAMGHFPKRMNLTHDSKSQHFVLSLNLSLSLPENWRAF